MRTPLATLEVKYATPTKEKGCRAELYEGHPFFWENLFEDDSRPRAHVKIVDGDGYGSSAYVAVFEGIARQVRDRLLLPNGYHPEEVWWFHQMPGSFYQVTFRDPRRLETPIWDPSKRLEEAETPGPYLSEDEPDEPWDIICLYRKETVLLSKIIWALEAAGLPTAMGEEEVFQGVAEKIRSVIHMVPIEEPQPGRPLN